MATSNRSGPNSAANPPQEHPREGEAGQERAWLAGLAWLNGLTPAERDAALATAGTPAPTPDGAGTPSRARPPKVKIEYDDAEFGYSWFAALNPDQRGACIDWFNSQAAPALAAAATPAQTPGAAGDPSRAETLLYIAREIRRATAAGIACSSGVDIASEIRRWGSVGLFGAADRLEAVAQEMAAHAPVTRSNDAAASTSAAWTPAAARVSLARDALFGAIQVADLLISELAKDRSDESPLYLGLTVRVRELADAADLLLTNPDCCDEEDAIPQASRTIFGQGYRPRATEGASL